MRRLLPSRCLLCGDRGTAIDLCIGCQRDLPWQQHACRCCGIAVPATVTYCAACQQQPPPFATLRAPFRYQSPIRELIIDFKFHRRLAIAPLLASLLALRINAPLPDLLLPVPLHRERLQQRGFNQALELARPLARQFQLQLDRQQWCQRQRATATQSTLNAAERHANLSAAFRVTRPLTGMSVAIIDDVVTTGTTVSELSTTLRAAGAQRIEVWCVARAGYSAV